jgi:hypothetical protein
MKMFISRMLFLVLFLSITAAGQTGRVKGKVFLPDGEPAIGAAVYISQSGIRTKTDIDGEYLLLNIHPGTHALTAEYIGYLDTTIVFDIEAKQHLIIDLFLDETISARGARRDIENGVVKILFWGGLLITTGSVPPLEEVAKLTSEYGFRYDYSCQIYNKEAEDEYNSAVYEYLDQRNGKQWRKEFQDKYDKLEKEYNEISPEN